MADYGRLVQYSAEQAWQYRQQVADPAMARLAVARRERQIQRREQRTPGIPRHQRFARWLGDRLVHAGEHLRSGTHSAAGTV
jgi:hypothetical protein